jgi:hypothetical protein
MFKRWAIQRKGIVVSCCNRRTISAFLGATFAPLLQLRAGPGLQAQND